MNKLINLIFKITIVNNHSLKKLKNKRNLNIENWKF